MQTQAPPAGRCPTRAELLTMVGISALLVVVTEHRGLSFLYAFPGMAGDLIVGVTDPELPAWVAALDLPAPDWRLADNGLEFRATWPDDTWTDLGFRLVCHRPVGSFGDSSFGPAEVVSC